MHRGLDSHSCYQVVSLLRHLAAQGRTIICTIHQPSARLFQQFEQVYILAMGECLYQGGTEKIVPYLQSVNLPCPMYHNPADYSEYWFCSLYFFFLGHFFVWRKVSFLPSVVVNSSFHPFSIRFVSIQSLNWHAVNMAWTKSKQWSKVWTMVNASTGSQIRKKFINWKHYGKNIQFDNHQKKMVHLNRWIHFISSKYWCDADGSKQNAMQRSHI